MTTILVTGGNGFIGSHVVHELQRRGDIPIVFDRRATADILGDIRDRIAITEAAAHADAIIHLAGVLGTQETIDDPYPATETNVLGGLNVLAAAKQYDLPLVNIAVGNHWMDNPYSISKTTVERYCRMYRREHGLTVATVRVMNAYGPGQIPASPYGPSKVRKITPAFVCRALLRQPIEIYGDGTQVMDMIYVTDVADALCDALGHAEDIEVGTARPTTVNDIAHAVLETVGGGATHHLPMRPGEPEQASVLAKQPYKNATTLEDGMSETVWWYRTHWLHEWESRR